MNQQEIVLQKLSDIPEKEWVMIANTCKKHIRLRVGQKTLFGAHSEKNLSMSAFDYYFTTAIEKIYSGTWKWKYEKFTITEQLIRLIDSLISEEVRKYRTNKDDLPSFVDADSPIIGNLLKLSYTGENNQQMELEHKKLFEEIEKVVNGNFELQFILQCFREGKSYNEISIETGMDKKALYKSLESLKLVTRTHFKNNRISIEL